MCALALALTLPGTAAGAPPVASFPLTQALAPDGGRGVVARSQASGIDVRHYALDLTLPGGGVATLSGAVTITGTLTASSDSICLDLVGLTVTAVTEDAAPLQFAQTDSLVRIALPAPRAAGAPFTLSVTYAGIATGGYFSYARNSYTFVEPSDARHWFPCHDDPGDKADSVLVRVTAPSAWPLFSTGVQVSSVPDPLAGTTTWTWRESHPIATYLVAVTFGDYAVWEDSAASTDSSTAIPLTYAVFPEDLAKAQYDFATVPDMMTYYQGAFGPYPFDKYGMVAVEPFGAGGMEHQSMTTINRSWVTGTRAREAGIAHELVHQWFGDLLTPAQWADIWLNEGFATYGDLLYRQYAHGDSAFEAGLRQARAYYFSDDGTARYAVYDPPRSLNGHDYLFGLTVYYKGAWVLHMLRSMVGDAAFAQILQVYVQRHAYGTVSTPDFQHVCEEVDGQSLQWFFDQWIYQAGYPVLQAAALASVHADGTIWVNVGVTQAQVNAPIFRLPLSVRVTTAEGDTTVTQTMSGLTASYYFPVRGWPTSVVLDPDLTLLFQQTGATSVQALALDALALSPPRPTPWSAFVDVTVTVAQATSIEVTVHDVRGRLVRVLCRDRLAPGGRTLRWDGRVEDGRVAPAGVYLIRAHRDGATRWQRTVKLR